LPFGKNCQTFPSQRQAEADKVVAVRQAAVVVDHTAQEAVHHNLQDLPVEASVAAAHMAEEIVHKVEDAAAAQQQEVVRQIAAAVPVPEPVEAVSLEEVHHQKLQLVGEHQRQVVLARQQQDR